MKNNSNYGKQNIDRQTSEIYLDGSRPLSIRKASPELLPPEPAANSATIAPISERPAAIFNPATMLGIALGILRYNKSLKFCRIIKSK